MVIGVDEVGRGAWAGPVIAASAAMKIFNEKEKLLKKIISLGINDSKKLTARKREFLSGEISKYFYCGIGEASVGEINRYGIVKATEKAMRRAVGNLTMKQFSNVTMNGRFFLLVDAFYVKYTAGIPLRNQKAIIQGDGKCISIAAASIVAKVYRDRLMERLSTKYTQYGWERNAGYGTEYHRRAIEKYGICKLHRLKFVD